MTIEMNGTDKQSHTVERRSSLEVNERRRSAGREDAEWACSELEQLRMIDPARAAAIQGRLSDQDARQQNEQRRASLATNDRRRSLGTEEQEWAAAETEQCDIIGSFSPHPEDEYDELGAPSYEEDEDGYTADMLIGTGPAFAVAPVLPSDNVPEGVATNRRSSVQEAQRRRSLGREDEEWGEAEQEQIGLM